MSEETIVKNWEEHPMLKPRIEKVVVNLNVGKSGEPLEKANKVLKEITGQTPVKKKAKKTIRDFGIREGESIAVAVTLRKKKAIDFLKKVLPVVDNKVPKKSFDVRGNFAFGLKEHIEIPGVKYDPDIGIFGMDVCVSLEKEGLRVGRRRRAQARAGREQRVSKEEAVAFMKAKFGVEIR